MFDLPNAKRVRRSDLHSSSPSSSRSSSPGIDILAHLRKSTQFELPPTATTLPSTEPAAQPAEEAEDEELEFRLFAPSKTTGTSTSNPESAKPAQTIRLRSPSADLDRVAGFLGSGRDEGCYFAGEASEEKKAEYQDVAVTGEQVRDMSRLKCTGCVYAWKVIRFPVSASTKPGDVKAVLGAEVEEEQQKKKCRKGKKSRIRIRVKAEKSRVKKEELGKLKEELERADREKRARRNREKKFKKRARDKAKKAAGGGDAGDEDDAESAEDSDGKEE